MVLEAKERGLRIFSKNEVEIVQNHDGTMHDSRKGFFKKLFRKKIRSWNSEIHGKPVLHESVLLRKLNRQNEKLPAYTPWILKSDFDTEIWPDSLRNLKRLGN